MFLKNTENKISFKLKNKERRQAFRLKMQPTFKIRINNQDIDVIDISADGISFRLADVSINDTLDIEFKLKDKIIYYQVIVLFIRAQSLCCCQFIAIDDNEKDKLHKFIIKEQKKMIRELFLN